MTIDFICQQCEGSFELEFSELLDGGALECPNCGQTSSERSAEEFANALDELLARSAKLRSRFVVSFAIDADELPPPYDDEDMDDDFDDEDEEDDEDDDLDFDDEDDEDDDYDDDED